MPSITVNVVPACPPLKTYTPAEQNKVAGEVAALPPNAETRVFIQDYGTLRADLRACNGQSAAKKK